ncbi:hypothetical protein GBAR_LOCUS19719, partial [Geodia barretti]
MSLRRENGTFRRTKCLSRTNVKIDANSFWSREKIYQYTVQEN